jgi:hypothetical protein
LESDCLPFRRGFVLFDYGFEEFIEVVDEGGFEELGGELCNVSVAIRIRYGALDSQYLQRSPPSASLLTHRRVVLGLFFAQ